MLKKAEENKVTVEVVPLDVCDLQSIHQAVQIVIEKENRIDILINNAGAGFAKATEHSTDEEIRWVTEVNYLSVGTNALTNQQNPIA